MSHCAAVPSDPAPMPLQAASQLLSAQDFTCNPFVHRTLRRIPPISLKTMNFGGGGGGVALPHHSPRHRYHSLLNPLHSFALAHL